MVVAFDGLDHELIQKFDCRNLLEMEEFGYLDNHTGMDSIKTSELFAAFITGKTRNGVTGLQTSNRPGLENLVPEKLKANVRGFQRLELLFQEAIGVEKRWYDRRDLTCETIFEKIEAAKALNVPSYNPSPFTQSFFELKKKGYSWERLLEYYDSREYRARKRELFAAPHSGLNLCMAHFHRPDIYQHIKSRDELEDLYRETDALAKRIKEDLQQYYDTVIFMSDHGMPQGNEHNRRAFYSCNKTVFGDTEPRITEFHDKILSAVDSKAVNISLDQKFRDIGEVRQR